MGSRPHQAVKNAQGNAIVCGLDTLVTAREHGQNWGGGRGALAMADVKEVGEVRSKREG
jgi:hypothetical protein